MLKTLIQRLIKQLFYWKIASAILAFLLLIWIGVFFYLRNFSISKIELVNELGGNVFPIMILSTATTGTSILQPVDSLFVGTPQSGIALKIYSPAKNTKVRISIEENPFCHYSTSEFILPQKETYKVYPDILWKYQVLANHVQAQPFNLIVHIEVDNKKASTLSSTLAMRSVNECLLGYIDERMKFHDTGLLFAAYVNEDNPQIDQLLREALNSRIVNRFWGYQSKDPAMIDKQVYALWYALQKRDFKYSSISNTSLSSNVVFAQRIRTFNEALASSQINCVDGSALFASLLKAVNIDPVLVRVPGHMFVGYYTDKTQKKVQFLETTMIGDVYLNDYFPDENLDSTMVGKSQQAISKILFEKSKEYANRVYSENDSLLHSGNHKYMFLKIDKNTRAKIQPLGK